MLELKNLHITVSDENGEKHFMYGVNPKIPARRILEGHLR